METCRHCGTAVPSRAAVPAHYRTCSSYKAFIERVTTILTRDYVVEHYVNRGKSLLSMARELGLDKVRLLEGKLREYGIRKRTLQEAKKMRHHVELAKVTSLERYGVAFHLRRGSALVDKGVQTSRARYGTDRPCQSDEIKESIKKTNLERWGHENVSSSIEVREKVRATSLERYGVDNPMKNEEVARRATQARATSPEPYRQSSRMADAFFDRLFALLPSALRDSVHYSNHRGEFGVMCPTSKRYYFYDFTVTLLRIAVEFNGAYYHASPDTHAADWVNRKRGMTAQEIWDADAAKADALRARGYRLLTVWEGDDRAAALRWVLREVVFADVRRTKQLR